jgi:type I restriction enzyme S subunit
MSQVKNLITEHLDTWTQAIQTRSSAGRGSNNKLNLVGIKKLRELILEMAVRGLLVPQDPNDEPASVLLEKMAAEKAQLIKDGKIKKSKVLPEISEDEKLFELPKMWSWTRLTDFCEIGPRNKDIEDDKEVSFIPMTLISINMDGSHSTASKKWSEIKSGFTHFADGDIAIAKITPSFENSKAAVFSGLINGVGAGTTELHVARPFTKLVVSRYSLLVVKTPSFLTIGEPKMTGSAGQKRVPKDFFAGYAFGLPPTEEQKRIVAKVDELMVLCDHLENQTLDSIEAHQALVETLLGNLVNPENTANFQQAWSLIAQRFDVLFTTDKSIDTLKKTILQLAVMGKLVPQNPNDEPASKLLEKIAKEKAQLIKDKKIKKTKPLLEISKAEKPFELPNGWEWVKLNKVISMMDAGWSPACHPEPSPNFETWGVLKTTAVQTLRFLAEENKVLPSSKEPRPQYEVQTGDILVTRAGPWNRVGVSCLVKETRPKLMTSDKLIRFHLVDVGMSEEYIVLALQAGATAEYLESCKSGMASSQVNISQDKLKAAPIPLPAKEEQTRIVYKVNELMTICDQLKTQLKTAQQTQAHLAQSIAQEALA